MNNDFGTHEPSSKFRARLESELERGLHRTRRFGPAATPVRTWRVAKAFGIAASAVLTLAIGIVLGASVSYASAAVPELRRPPLAILPIGNAINALRCAPVAALPQTSKAAAPAQQSIPIVEMSAPTAKTSIKLAAVLGLKETSDGWVLVEDAGRHQVRLFEPSLATSTVVIDSAPGSARSYGIGNVPRPIVPYLGDSSLFIGKGPREMLVLDGRGEIARALALVGREDAAGVHSRGAGFDPEGRMVYKKVTGSAIAVKVPFSASLLPRQRPDRPGLGGTRGGGPTPDGITVYISNQPDSIPIHRADYAARRIDTLGYVNEPLDERDDHGNPDGKLVAIYDKDGTAIGIKSVINPIRTIDEWAVLSDGTIAIVRGHDYHVDWIHPDGTRSASPKLPFEWKRLTDDDKQRIVDSTRALVDSIHAWAERRANGTPAPTDSIPTVDSLRRANGPRAGNCGSPGLGVPLCPPGRKEWPYEIVSLSQIADYWPPFRDGAALADRDGNLWILPRTTLSKNGELVYDVVNPKQGLVRRVRLPVGRSIAGFGKGGVVYLQAGDIRNGFILERATVPGATTPAPRSK
jgi:hypothetical protein